MIKKIIKSIITPFLIILYKFSITFFNVSNKSSKKFYSCICVIFKDEGRYLKEWIEYYKIIGIDHIYMYNNFSSDNYKEILQPYIEMNYITLTEWPIEQGQISCYKHCVNNYSSQCTWLGFLDIDEFFVSKNHLSINEELKQYEKYPSVVFNWKTFGTSDIIQRDETSPVIKDFTKCTKDYYWGKYFFNTSYMFNFDYKYNKIPVHSAWFKVGLFYIPPINSNFKFYFFTNISKLNKTDKLNCWINHYYTKSKMEFQERIKKTDVAYKTNNKTMKDLEWVDSQCISQDFTIQYFLPKLENSLNK